MGVKVKNAINLIAVIYYWSRQTANNTAI